jgi:hypothetical protein
VSQVSSIKTAIYNAEPVLARHYPGTLDRLAAYLGQPHLIEYLHRFLYDQVHPDVETCGMDVQLDLCPEIAEQLWIKVFHSATSTYYVLPPAATLAMLEVRGERKYEGNQPKVSYRFCQELNPELQHDGGPCDCMSSPHPFL